MTSVQRIEQEVRELSETELAEFRAWFESFDQKRWDAKLERDAASGKLDRLADEALSDHDAGRSRPL